MTDEIIKTIDTTTTNTGPVTYPITPAVIPQPTVVVVKTVVEPKKIIPPLPDKLIDLPVNIKATVKESKIRTLGEYVAIILFTSFISFNVGVIQTKNILVPKVEKTQIELNHAQAKIDAEKQTHAVVANVKKYYLLIENPNGSFELRTGGSPSWRYNNPGKLSYGNYAKTHGAIGHDGPIAIFPSYDEGLNAFEDFLFKSDFGYKNMTIEDAVNKLAPASDGYNTAEYLKAILDKTKLSKDRVLNTMTADDRGNFIDAIKEYEVWVAGNIRKFKDKAEFQNSGY